MVSHAEEVFVVEEQFFEAGAGDVGEFHLHFRGGHRGFAGFGDVLLSRAGGLDHLVDGAVAALEEALTEPVGEAVDDLGFPVGKQIPVVAARREESFGGGHGEAETYRACWSYRTYAFW